MPDKRDVGIFTPSDVKSMADQFHETDDPLEPPAARAKRAAAIVEQTIERRMAQLGANKNNDQV